MEYKINLEEIINSLQNSYMIKSSQSLTIDFKIAMLLFGEQLLELAAENAKITKSIEYPLMPSLKGHYEGELKYTIDKLSILDTIKQIE